MTLPTNRRPYADVTRQAVDAAPPLTFPEERLPADHKPVGAERSEPRADISERPTMPVERAAIEVRTTVEHRGRVFTIVATGYTLDQLCDMLDRRGFQPPAPATAPALPAPVATSDDLPDGWKLCPKHGAPMRPRNKQGDVWHSHNVGTRDNPIYCKGYKGADSPGYDR